MKLIRSKLGIRRRRAAGRGRPLVVAVTLVRVPVLVT
jgi:hypothetical protein